MRLPVHIKRSTYELAGWILAFLLLYGVAFFNDGHEALDAFFQSHEQYDLDELFVAINIAGMLGLVYSVLRIKDLSSEIKRRQKAEENVDWIACHDALTELPNRRYLNSICKRFSARKSVGESYAVIGIDLDGFKKVNDLLGHQGGDQVLRHVAVRLSQIFPDDEIFRLGGDEFLVLAKRTANFDVMTVGSRITRSLSRPMTIDGAEAEIGASVGVSFYPEGARDLQEVITQSDCAMYAAKKLGRNLVMQFEPSMQEELQRRTRMEADLKIAMREGAIKPYYQPLVDLKTKSVIGYEALARWETSPGEFTPPDEFIPLAEDTGLIVELTEQLFRRACADALMWPPHTVLSFNISSIQLSDRLLGLRLLKILDEVGLSVDRIELEVTESALIKDAETAKIVLSSLTAAGIKIALDDFGTGYSSLSYLSRYPARAIRAFRSFRITSSTRSRSIAASSTPSKPTKSTTRSSRPSSPSESASA